MRTRHLTGRDLTESYAPAKPPQATLPKIWMAVTVWPSS